MAPWSLVAQVGSGSSLIIDGASFLLMAALLTRVHLPDRAPRGSSVSADLRDGFAYVRGSAALTLLPLVALVINATLAPLEMLLHARMHALGVGASGFGLFFGVLTGGMATGSLLLAQRGERLSYRSSGVLGFAVSGVLFALLSLTQTAPQMYVVRSWLALLSPC